MYMDPSEWLPIIKAKTAGTSPLLAPEQLQSFVRYYFDRRDTYLEVLKNHPAPLYLQESSVLRAKAARMKHAFEHLLPEVAFYFAVKSNNHPHVAGVLIDEGFGLDVSSGQELESALFMGAPDIVFSGPGKTLQELRLAVSHADRVVILMDSFGELGQTPGAAGCRIGRHDSLRGAIEC